jgi:glycosyltransferase involved in cell wall biosynthesis
MAMVFPIQWNEPFGLVMIEAMATGTPVLAFPGGAVEEIVADGVSGFICHSPDEMIERLRNVGSLAPAALRSYVRQNFSVEKMARDYLALYREVLGLPQTVEHAAALSLNELDDTEEPPGRAVA